MIVLFGLQPLDRTVGVVDIDVGAMFEEASSRGGGEGHFDNGYGPEHWMPFFLDSFIGDWLF